MLFSSKGVLPKIEHGKPEGSQFILHELDWKVEKTWERKVPQSLMESPSGKPEQLFMSIVFLFQLPQFRLPHQLYVFVTESTRIAECDIRNTLLKQLTAKGFK